MLLYEKYSSFIFLSYFTPHHPFQWVKYSSNQKIIWSSEYINTKLPYIKDNMTITLLSSIKTFIEDNTVIVILSFMEGNLEKNNNNNWYTAEKYR